MSRYNAVVIGAGPAGALAAHQLASAGSKRVLLVDKSEFPRRKVCGCSLNGAALDQLEQAGLGSCIRTLGVPLTALNLYVDGERLEIKLPAGLALSRELLDSTLVRKAEERGVEFRSNHSAVVLSADESISVVQLTEVQTGAVMLVETDIVIVADGLGGNALQNFPLLAVTSMRNSKIGVGCRLEEAPAIFTANKIHMSYGACGYAGVVALEDGSFDLAAALSPNALRAGPDISAIVRKIFQEAGIAQPDLSDHSQWRGTKPLTSRRNDVAAVRIFVVGDSASYVEPFTGEGIAWALASARCVVPIAVKAIKHWDDLAAAEWRYVHRRVIHRRQSTSKLVAGTLRQRQLSSALASVLRQVPFLVEPVVRQLNSPIEVSAHG